MADLLKGTHNTEETTISNDIDELFPKCRVKPAKSQDRYRNNNGPMFIRSNGSAVDLLMSPNNNTSVLPCYSESQDRRIMFQEGDEDLLGLDSPSSRKDSFSESGGSGGSCAEDLRKPEAKWVEAGAKEVFSQSRARAGRKRSGDDWGKKIKRVDAETTCRPVKVYKETVFASEIQTLENTYRPCADPDVTVLDSGKTRSYQSSPEENRTFDEIGEYPRSRLDTLSGSTVKNLAESLLMMSPASTQIGDPDAGNTSDDSMPSSTMPYACLSTVTDAGRPALPNWNSSGSPETNSPTSSPVACVIGSVPIAKYEGSPRRLGARHRASPAIPGFGNYLPKPGHPQRILAQVDVLGGLDQNTAEKGELKDTKIDTTLTPVKDEMELGRESLSAIIPELGQVLKPKEDAPFAHQPSPESVYEFSETRKVLEEFFGGAHPSIMSLSKDEQKASRAGSNAGRRSQRDSDEAIKTSSNNETRNQARSSVRRVKMNNNGYAMNLIIRPNTSSPSSSLSVDQETLSTEDFGETEIGIRVEESRNFTLSPETTECEDPSDLESFVCEDPEQPDSEEGSRVSSVEGSGKAESTKSGAVGVMPVLEDGLSSGDEGRPDEPDLINAGDDFCVSKMNGDRMVEEFLRGNTSSGGLLGLAGRIQAEPQSSPTRAAIQREMRALEHELQARARARARALRKHRRASPKSDLDQPTMDYRDSVSHALPALGTQRNSKADAIIIMMAYPLRQLGRHITAKVRWKLRGRLRPAISSLDALGVKIGASFTEELSRSYSRISSFPARKRDAERCRPK
ncbi:unnamed protein product [Notodromas monacha]|uniref:Uncharacterized protein n=1 Tax=Notodromas monacha TaxID=399045 RepID=A0A7R9BGR7_9CRUS|nr:unnamed protein product [Notodromas monacha]CAG0914334.1 unnamed protein product [Notodromas monacha]